MGVSGQLRASAYLPLPADKFPGTHWIGDWVDPRASLDTVAKKKSLYCLSYPSSLGLL